MRDDGRIDERLAMALEGLQGSLLVKLHQSAIPSHVGGQDGCQPTLDAWFRAVLLHPGPHGWLLSEEGCHDDRPTPTRAGGHIVRSLRHVWFGSNASMS